MGEEGSIIHVKSGYARNYLIPYGKAIYATEYNISNFHKKKIFIDKKIKIKCTELKKLSKKILSLSPLIIRFRSKKNGRLFGSVNVINICKIFSDKLGFHVSKKYIVLSKKSFKYLGFYNIKIIVNKVNIIDFSLNILPVINDSK